MNITIAIVLACSIIIGVCLGFFLGYYLVVKPNKDYSLNKEMATDRVKMSDDAFYNMVQKTFGTPLPNSDLDDPLSPCYETSKASRAMLKRLLEIEREEAEEDVVDFEEEQFIMELGDDTLSVYFNGGIEE